MANRLAMDVAGGLSKLPPREILAGIDPRDIHVGVENPWQDTPGGSDQEMYNRKALPWEGGAYTLVGGSWVKIAGRPNAVTGDQMESQFPNLAQVWQQFAQAQQNRRANPGSLAQLRTDLSDVAANISQVGNIIPAQGEGQSLYALKQARKGR